MNGNPDRTRSSRVMTVDDPGGSYQPAGKTYRCQVYLYPRSDGGFLAVAATLTGVAGAGTSEAEALADITRSFQAVIPMYTREGGKIPWQENPAEPQPGWKTRWVFPEV